MSRARFWNSPKALISITVIAIMTIVALLGSYIRPDSSENANQQNLALARSLPGTTAQTLLIRKNTIEEPSALFQGLLFGGLESEYAEMVFDSIRFDHGFVQVWHRGDERGRYSYLDVLYPLNGEEVSVAQASMIGWLQDGTVLDMDIKTLELEIRASAIAERWYVLGTDSYGRDMLSRLMGGAVISLSVGFISVLISLLIGIPLGAMAGYFGGRVDALVMWFINVIWSIPTLLMVIAITLVMGKGFVQVFIAVGLTMWVEVARIVRGQVLALREAAFIQAAQTMGFSHLRIIARHLLPNSIGPVIVISAANFASAILIEAGLSFLGIGTQIPMPSWGTMIKEHYPYITTDMAYLALLPGLCIMILVFAFMLLGDRLREHFDVRSMN